MNKGSMSVYACRREEVITEWTAATARVRGKHKVLVVEQHVEGVDDANKGYKKVYRAEYVETNQEHSFEFSKVRQWILKLPSVYFLSALVGIHAQTSCWGFGVQTIQ